jgi:hypothetical protein
VRSLHFTRLFFIKRTHNHYHPHNQILTLHNHTLLHTTYINHSSNMSRRGRGRASRSSSTNETSLIAAMGRGGRKGSHGSFYHAHILNRPTSTDSDTQFTLDGNTRDHSRNILHSTNHPDIHTDILTSNRYNSLSSTHDNTQITDTMEVEQTLLKRAHSSSTQSPEIVKHHKARHNPKWFFSLSDDGDESDSDSDSPNPREPDRTCGFEDQSASEDEVFTSSPNEQTHLKTIISNSSHTDDTISILRGEGMETTPS